MRKRIIGMVAALMLFCGIAQAQPLGIQNIGNYLFLSGTTACTGVTLQTPPPRGSGYAVCIDSNGVYPWTGSAFVGPSLGSPTISSPTITGTVAGGASYTAPTLTSPVLTSATLNGTITNGTAYQAFTISSPVCTTSGIAGLCAEPTHTLSPGFADANYFISCTMTANGTGVPVVNSVTKASNAVVVNIAAMTAVSASAATIDCIASH